MAHQHFVIMLVMNKKRKMVSVIRKLSGIHFWQSVKTYQKIIIVINKGISVSYAYTET
jgi:hypothetical protein